MRVEKLKLIQELPNKKVECEDLEGLRWIVSEQSFNRFKYTGFLYVPKIIAAQIQTILNGRNLETLSKAERKLIMKELLELVINEPLENMFPDLAKLEIKENEVGQKTVL